MDAEPCKIGRRSSAWLAIVVIALPACTRRKSFEVGELRQPEAGTQTLSVASDGDDGGTYTPAGISGALVFDACASPPADSAGIGSSVHSWAYFRFTLDQAIPAAAVIAPSSSLRLWVQDASWDSSIHGLSIVAVNTADALQPSTTYDTPDNFVGRNVLSDPGFEAGASGFVPANASDTAVQSTADPIAGAASLTCAINAWGNIIGYDDAFPAGTVHQVTSVDVRAKLRKDDASNTDIRLCASAYYYGGKPSEFGFTTAAASVGDVQDLSFSLPVDPSTDVNVVSLWFRSEGASPVLFTVDEASLTVSSALPAASPPTAPVRWPTSGGLAPVRDAWNEAPVAPLLQELVDAHQGLEAGAHVTLWLTGSENTGVSHTIAFEDFCAGAGHAAELTIDWTAP